VRSVRQRGVGTPCSRRSLDITCPSRARSPGSPSRARQLHAAHSPWTAPSSPTCRAARSTPRRRRMLEQARQAGAVLQSIAATLQRGPRAPRPPAPVFNEPALGGSPPSRQRRGDPRTMRHLGEPSGATNCYGVAPWRAMRSRHGSPMILTSSVERDAVDPGDLVAHAVDQAGQLAAVARRCDQPLAWTGEHTRRLRASLAAGGLDQPAANSPLGS